MKIFYVSSSWIDQLMIKNIRLTINHDVPMMANHRAALFSMLKPSPYFLLSHPDVNILNHAYKHRTSEIADSKPSSRLMAVCMVWIKESFWFLDDQGTFTSAAHQVSQNPKGPSASVVHGDKHPKVITAIPRIISFLIIFHIENMVILILNK